jgi:hypothetical protein
MRKVNSSNLKVGSGPVALTKSKAQEINSSHCIFFLVFSIMKKGLQVKTKNTRKKKKKKKKGWASQQ